MIKSGHLRQILRERISYSLDTSAKGSSNTIITANIPPTTATDVDRRRQRQLAYVLIAGIFFAPPALLLFLLFH